jgi:hypothetical protein
MPEDDRDRYCCSGCPSLGGPSGIGGSFYCESGDDQIDLETHDGRPLRSAQCVAANQPLLTREEFLAAVREECEDDELVLPFSPLVETGTIQWHFDSAFNRLYVRLRDAFVCVPTQRTPAGGCIAFVGAATWGARALKAARASFLVSHAETASLEAILAGLGETEPGAAPHD